MDLSAFLENLSAKIVYYIFEHAVKLNDIL